MYSTTSHRISFGLTQAKSAQAKWVSKFPVSYEIAMGYFTQIFLLDLRVCSSLQQWIQIICMKEQDIARDLNIDLDLSPDEAGYFDIVRYCIKIAKIKHGNGVRDKAYKTYWWLYRNENIDELKINAYNNILSYLDEDQKPLVKVLHKLK